MKGLKLFSKTNSKGHWNLASYHPPQSLTWTWILSFSLPRGDEGRWLGFHMYKTNQGRKWLLQIARCAIRWERQRPMWYRDIWQRERAKRDRDSYERYLMRSAQGEHSAGPEHPTIQ